MAENGVVVVKMNGNGNRMAMAMAMAWPCAVRKIIFSDEANISKQNKAMKIGRIYFIFLLFCFTLKKFSTSSEAREREIKDLLPVPPSASFYAGN